MRVLVYKKAVKNTELQIERSKEVKDKNHDLKGQGIKNVHHNDKKK